MYKRQIGKRKRMTGVGRHSIVSALPCFLERSRRRRDGFASRNLSETLMYLYPYIPTPSLLPRAVIRTFPSIPTVPLSTPRRSDSWLSFHWIGHILPPSGSRLSFTVRAFSGVFRYIYVTSPLWQPGINFTLCWICGYVLIKKKSKTPWLMLAVVVFQWMLSSIHVSLGFTVRICSLHLPPLHHESSPLLMQRLIYGFIYNRDKPGGPAAYFSDISIPGNVAKVFIHTLNVSFLSPTGRPSSRGPRTDLFIFTLRRAQSAVGDGVVVWRWGGSHCHLRNFEC